MTGETRMGYGKAWAVAAAAGFIALGAASGGAFWTARRVQASAEARAAIGQAVAETIFAQDRHDGMAFAGHFVPDGVVRITQTERPVTARGQAALQAFGSGPATGADLPFSSAPGDIHHVVTNSAVELLDAGRARHRAYYVALARDKAGRGIVFVQMGSFEDTFVRRGGRWLIAEHHIRHRGGVGGGG